MTADDPTQADDSLADWLAEYDEARRVGRADLSPDPNTIDADRRPRSDRLVACIDLLDRVWPRRNGAAGGTADVTPTKGPGETINYDGKPESGGFVLNVPAATPPFTLPGFDIQEELGRGGMGIVYRARQRSLDRDVALKVLPPAMAADPGRLRRFRNEATVAAGLTDSRILPVYDILDAAGVPVLVMPFVDGPDLGRIINDRRLARQGNRSDDPGSWSRLSEREYLERVLPLLDQIIEAVAVLHEADIIHRDIKPSNIMIDPRGNVRLSDFGLARLGREAQMTSPGSELGTPGFMAPEQWEGKEDIDSRADVYSLGATIYEALTLALPHSRSRVSRQTPPPLPPSRRLPLLGKDFDAVVLKALEPDRKERYGSVAEFQDDWRRVRQGLLPTARRAGPVRRAARWARRHPWGVADAAIVIILLGSLGGLWLRPTPTPLSLAPASPLRVVRLDTKPRGARVVLVPLNDKDGDPRPAQAVRAAKTPATLRLAPGDYLVEVEVAGFGFHEVRRHVPRPGEMTGSFNHNRWSVMPNGTIALVPILVPRATVADGMTSFAGSEDFLLGAAEFTPAPPHRRPIRPFQLDTAEVTVGDYRRLMDTPPEGLSKHPPRDEEAVRLVDFDHAMLYAELAGKRLPTEAEYEYAATGRGRWKFPWGDAPGPLLGRPWTIGPVRQPDFDRTDTVPPVFGLYSNVAEWTSSWPTSYPMPQLSSNLGAEGEFLNTRVVRGGPYFVVIQEGESNDELTYGPRWRHFISRDRTLPGLGFRCARSARPRYLDPGPTLPQGR